MLCFHLFKVCWHISTVTLESSAGGGAGGSPVTDQREPMRERSASREHRQRRAVSASRPVSCKFNNRDASFTQFAVIDDDNVSALQQVTRGGGGLYEFFCSFYSYELFILFL